MFTVKPHNCKECGETRPEKFWHDRKSLCYACQKIKSAESNKKWASTERGKELKRQASKKFYAKNRDSVSEKMKKYYQENKARVLMRTKHYQRANKERIKQYYQENKERILVHIRNWRKNNREKVNDCQRMRRQRIKAMNADTE
jgi:hypothetical protein